MLRKIPFLSLFVYVVLSFMFCLLNYLPVQAAPVAATSYVRVIHASPFVGAADVFVDGKLLLTSFQFGSVTDYVPLPAGPHKVQISVVGKGINASVLEQDLTVGAGGIYTVAALGTKADALSLLVFADDNQVVPNRAKVRVYHLGPDAGQIDVNIGGDVTLNNVSYIQASNYVNEDVGPCPINFSDSQFSKTLTMTPNLRLNTVTSIFVVGLFQGNPKIQLVDAQATGIPGMPNTGSDPTPLHNFSDESWLPWILASATVLLMSVGTVAYRHKLLPMHRG